MKPDQIIAYMLQKQQQKKAETAIKAGLKPSNFQDKPEIGARESILLLYLADWHNLVSFEKKLTNITWVIGYDGLPYPQNPKGIFPNNGLIKGTIHHEPLIGLRYNQFDHQNRVTLRRKFDSSTLSPIDKWTISILSTREGKMPFFMLAPIVKATYPLILKQNSGTIIDMHERAKEFRIIRRRLGFDPDIEKVKGLINIAKHQIKRDRLFKRARAKITKKPSIIKSLIDAHKKRIAEKQKAEAAKIAEEKSKMHGKKIDSSKFRSKKDHEAAIKSRQRKPFSPPRP